MTDLSLLAAIKASMPAMSQADAGNDSGVATTITAGITQPTPFNFTSLMGAAPTTLGTLKLPSELEPIAARLRASDWAGIGAWADALLAASVMPSGEHTAVDALVTAASIPPDSVDHNQVARVLAPYRVDSSGVARGLPITWSNVP
jgi:hypothetical protein